MAMETAIETVTEEVAANLEEVAEATRRINATSASWFVGGAIVGGVIGFYLGYKFNKEKIRAEAFRESEQEVEKIRELYQQKVVAATPKPDLEDIVEEQGYATERPLKPVVPVQEAPVHIEKVDRIELHLDQQPWDYQKEMAARVKGEPYVIHQDEFMENTPGYERVVYTYYAGDDVLVDEETGHPLPHADIIVGRNNLKFGHGTDDEDVVFVRNDERELQMEICRTNDSYEEKVLGLENSHDDDDEDSD